MKKHVTVEDYVASLAPREGAVLSSMRKTIRSGVPDADEKISYGIPTFTYHGNLVHDGASKNHLSFYPGSKSVMKRFAAELSDFETSSGATIRFQADKPIPAALVKKIVRARMAENTGASR